MICTWWSISTSKVLTHFSHESSWESAYRKPSIIFWGQKKNGVLIHFFLITKPWGWHWWMNFPWDHDWSFPRRAVAGAAKDFFHWCAGFWFWPRSLLDNSNASSKIMRSNKWICIELRNGNAVDRESLSQDLKKLEGGTVRVDLLNNNNSQLLGCDCFTGWECCGAKIDKKTLELKVFLFFLGFSGLPKGAHCSSPKPASDNLLALKCRISMVFSPKHSETFSPCLGGRFAMFVWQNILTPEEIEPKLSDLVHRCRCKVLTDDMGIYDSRRISTLSSPIYSGWRIGIIIPNDRKDGIRFRWLNHQQMLVQLFLEYFSVLFITPPWHILIDPPQMKHTLLENHRFRWFPQQQRPPFLSDFPVTTRVIFPS